MILVSGPNSNRTRVDRHPSTRTIIVFHGERSADVLDADAAGPYCEGMRGIMNDAEIRNAIQSDETLVHARRGHYQSAGRTEEDFGAILQYNLTTLANTGGVGVFTRLEAGPTHVLPQRQAADDDDYGSSHARQSVYGAARVAIVDWPRCKWEHARLVHACLDGTKGTLDINVGRIIRPTGDDRFKRTHDVSAMRIGVDPASRRFGFACGSFSGDVARDALPVIRTEVGGTAV